MEKINEHVGGQIGGPAKLSKYAQKQKTRLLPPEEIAKELAALPPVTAPRNRGLVATVPNFTSRNDFVYLRTADGESLFLSVHTIRKCGHKIVPGDTVHCDVRVILGEKDRRVVFIHKVERANKF